MVAINRNADGAKAHAGLLKNLIGLGNRLSTWGYILNPPSIATIIAATHKVL
jgi:hypothetical protein